MAMKGFGGDVECVGAVAYRMISLVPRLSLHYCMTLTS